MTEKNCHSAGEHRRRLISKFFVISKSVVIFNDEVLENTRYNKARSIEIQRLYLFPRVSSIRCFVFRRSLS